MLSPDLLIDTLRAVAYLKSVLERLDSLKYRHRVLFSSPV